VSWTASSLRIEAAKVPEPFRVEKTKGQIALELLEQVRSEGLLFGDVVITDAAYAVAREFRKDLAQRRLSYITAVTSEMVVFTEEPRWVLPQPSTQGRPQTNPRLAEEGPRPI
jgi:SRSO17 transposase